MIERIGFNLEVKGVSAAGSFSGLASTYGNLDFHNDIVERGSFSDTLLKRGNEIPVLWGHDENEPVALGTLTDTKDGLHIDGQLDLDIQAGRDAHSRLTKRLCRGLSIGFRVPDGGSERKNGVRHLRKIDLFEVSLVAIPANDKARITSVKSAITDLRSFERWLHESGFSRSESKRLAMHGFNGLGAADADAGEDDTELLAWLRSQRKAA